PTAQSSRPLRAPRSPGASLPGSIRARGTARRGASFGSLGFGIPCLPLRSGSYCFDRRIWRFLKRGLGAAAGCEISIHGRVYFPHSLGIFYQALTQYLGFPHYGDEYKVMGLAPYARPSFLDHMRKIVRLLPGGGFELDLKFFRHHREDVPYQWPNGSPEFGDLFSPALEDLLGPRRLPADPLADRHRDVAPERRADGTIPP